MKPYLLVLIAAVTVNCLVTAINGETSSEALTVPYIDMLLPPYEDKADSSGEASTAVEGKAEINVKAKVTPVLKTTKSKTTAKTTAKTTTTTTTTTKKPIINDVNNNLAAPSLEALLPPLFEAKTEEPVTTTTTKRTTTTRRPTTTTTRRPTTKRTTTTTTTTTRKPITTTTTTTLKPTKATKIQVPDLLLEPLLPPLVDNEIVTKDEVAAPTTTTTTEKPLFKTTKKSHYQQQQQQQLKHLPIDNKKDLKNFHTLKTGLKTNGKHVAETKIQAKQVTALPSNIESVTKQHVAKQTTTLQERRATNYNYDLYFGSTTPRPLKNGLPTITPFPHRLGR